MFDRAALREALRVRVAALRRTASSVLRSAGRHRAELLTCAAVLGGWACVTAGVRLIAPSVIARAVWPVSTGVLLLSGAGWGFVVRLAVTGLYVATRSKPGGN